MTTGGKPIDEKELLQLRFIGLAAEHDDNKFLEMERIKRQINMNGPDSSGQTALVAAIRRVPMEAEVQDYATVSYLLQNGANPNSIYKSKTDQPSSSHEFSYSYSLLIIQSLINAGAKVSERDESGKTPLHFVAQAGCIEAARLFLERGYPFNASNTYMSWFLSTISR